MKTDIAWARLQKMNIILENKLKQNKFNGYAQWPNFFSIFSFCLYTGFDRASSLLNSSLVSLFFPLRIFILSILDSRDRNFITHMTITSKSTLMSGRPFNTHEWPPKYCSLTLYRTVGRSNNQMCV